MMWKMYQFWLLVVLASISWGIFLLVITNISPLESPQLGFPLLYIGFFFALLFTSATLYSLLWKAIFPVKSSYICIKNGIREGIFTGIGGTIIMFFLQMQSFSWIEVLAIFGIIIIIELFFI